MTTLVILVLLPLGMIGVQIALDLDSVLGLLGYSSYKLFFLVPPLIYCRVHKIKVSRDILKFRHGRRYLGLAIGLGGLAIAVFWGVYFAFGDMLLDKEMIVDKIGDQFKVTPKTVFLIAPVTILLNSLLEEFFYRGFSFGRMVTKQRTIAYLLPAAAFTIQHMLFIYHWLTLVPQLIAVFGLFVFALVLQKIYESADSIVAPWIIHMFGDFAMMSIAVTLLWS